jgi:hypothetical protein
MGEVSALVGQLHATVVGGPSRAGAFELAVPKSGLGAAVDSLGKADSTVNGVFLDSPCVYR